MRYAHFLLALLLAHFVAADVDIQKPESGQLFDASSGLVTVDIEWEDDAEGFSFSDLDRANHYDIVLMTGNNDNIGTVKQVGTKIDNTERSFSAEIDNDVGPNGYYFFQIYTQFSNEGYTIHYTNRFRLTGMQGESNSFTYPASIFSYTGDQPEPQFNAGGTALKVESSSFTVPYTAQSGWLRYAPMMESPASTITATTYNSRHATSDYTAYSTTGPDPDAYSTASLSRTYFMTSRENRVPVNTYPTYWYPASSRIRLATLSDARNKRWL